MTVKADLDLLSKFEENLNPQNIQDSPIPAQTLGYGEISLIFKIGDDLDKAYKRLPLFSGTEAAENYRQHYRSYCRLLREVGLNLPDDDTCIIRFSNRPTVLYIAQSQFPAEAFGHRLLHSLSHQDIEILFRRVVSEVAKIWRFNTNSLPAVELAIDGQISNWVWIRNGPSEAIYYVDTSTPLFRTKGEIQLDPELFLKSAPSFLRWIIRWLFLKDVLDRYFNERLVFIDLAANLFKEQKSDLIPMVVDIINGSLSEGVPPLSVKEVKRYYREDRTIWVVFLAFRRLDRWLKTKLLGKRYEFILPGKVKR